MDFAFDYSQVLTHFSPDDRLPFFHEDASYHPHSQANESDSAQPDVSPQSTSIDTTYEMSPRTDTNDMEVVYDSDDEDAVVRGVRPNRAYSATQEDKEDRQSVLTLPSPETYTLGDLDKDVLGVMSESRVKLFTSQLHEDIKTASLFTAIPPTTFSVLTPQPTPSSAVAVWTLQQQQQQHTMPPQVSPATDVTTLPANSNLVSRKPSMHLLPPSQPINPFRRPPQPAPTPIKPYPAVMIDRMHLRRLREERPAEQTLALKDLIKPNAEYHFGFDPKVMAAELTSPYNRDLEMLTEEYDDETEEEAQAQCEVTPEPKPVASTSSPRVADATSPMTRSGMKRPHVLFAAEAETEDVEEDDDGEYVDEDALGEDDEDYKAPTSVRVAITASSEPLAKRARTSVSSASPAATVQSSPARRSPSPQPTVASRQRASKARTRHLQPGLVRANGCMHGCTLLFSTAYEARRHQEDCHGREEAYHLISQQKLHPSQSVLPRDYRFVIQIGISHNAADKWDGKTKNGFSNALAHEDSAMPRHLVSALLDFAREWTKRYECATCGTSFSRLDSKKRHYAKQCTPQSKRGSGA